MADGRTPIPQGANEVIGAEIDGQVLSVVRAASLTCQNAVKAQKFVPLQESSDEPRLYPTK